MKTILCYGDSLAWGRVPGAAKRHDRDTRWPALLDRALGDEVRVVEECLPGRTTAWDDPFHPGRNGRNLLGPLLESHAPVDPLILALGTEDLCAVYGVTAHESARGAQALIGIAKASGAGPGGGRPPVLLMAPPRIEPPRADMIAPFRGADEKSKAMALRYGAIARIENCAFYAAAKATEASVVDGVHLDAAGYRALAEALVAVVADLVGASAGDAPVAALPAPGAATPRRGGPSIGVKKAAPAAPARKSGPAIGAKKAAMTPTPPAAKRTGSTVAAKPTPAKKPAPPAKKAAAKPAPVRKPTPAVKKPAPVKKPAAAKKSIAGELGAPAARPAAPRRPA